MLVPHFITRPPVLLRHKFLEAFKGRNYSCANFCTESPATRRISFQAIRIFSKIKAGFKCSPRTTTGQALSMRVCLKITITSIKSPDIFRHPSFQRRLRIGLIIATPHGYTRVITNTFDFLHHIIIEHIEVIRQIRIRVYPKIVPYHNAIFITRLIEFIICNRTEPITYHIKVHFLMQTDFGIIFRTTATKHIFRHSPIRPFDKYRNIININMECITFFIIRIFLYTKRNIFRFRNLSIHHHLELTMIKIGVSISIRPPQTRLVYTQLWEITFVKLHLFSSMGIHL